MRKRKFKKLSKAIQIESLLHGIATSMGLEVGAHHSRQHPRSKDDPIIVHARQYLGAYGVRSEDFDMIMDKKQYVKSLKSSRNLFRLTESNIQTNKTDR